MPKRIKKSDMGKAWIGSRSSQKPRLIAPEYHLIVSEGTDTEPYYFNRLSDIINERFRDHIQLEIYGEGDNTVNLFKKAKEIVDNGGKTFKHVWLVYDKDDFPKDHFNRTAKLCESNSTEETIYHALWSNQCIELWFLLHFSYMQSDLHRTEYFPKLTECLDKLGKGKYEKNREDMFNILRPYIKAAIRNAKKLDVLNAGKSPADSAPGTKVYEIIEMLGPYLT